MTLAGAISKLALGMFHSLGFHVARRTRWQEQVAEAERLLEEKRCAEEDISALNSHLAELKAEVCSAWREVEARQARVDQLSEESGNAWRLAKQHYVKIAELQSELRRLYQSRHLIRELAVGLCGTINGRDRLVLEPPEGADRRRRLGKIFDADCAALPENDLLLNGIRVWAPTSFAGDMLLALPERVSEKIAETGDYEPDFTRAIMAMVGPGQVVFDVGAHFGYFSRLSALLVGPTGRVFAFEPTPRTRDVLQVNLEDLPQATIVPAAAWSSGGTLPFRVNTSMFSAFNSAFDPRLDDASKEAFEWQQIEVTATTLDAHADEVGLTPDFIKIDAESAEAHVIAGMANLLATSRPIVSLEVGDVAVAGATNSADLVSLMEGKGYVPVELVGTARVRRHRRSEDVYQVANLIFVPSERSDTFFNCLAVHGIHEESSTAKDANT